MHAKWQMHGSCVCKDGNAVLVTGSPGAGKSGLALRLLSRGFELVAEQVVECKGQWLTNFRMHKQLGPDQISFI